MFSKRKAPLPKENVDTNSSDTVVVMGTARRVKRRWSTIGGSLVMIGIIIGGLLWWNNAHFSTKPAFVINGVSYSQDDINKLIAEPVKKGANKTAAAKQAFQMYKVEAAAKKLGLKLTSAEIETARKQRLPTTTSVAKLTAWELLVARSQAFDTKITATNGDYPDVTATGYVYVFYFGNLIEKASDYIAANYGNKTLIAEDKAYAKQQADKYYKLLAAKTITPEQAYIEITADTRLNYHNLANGSLSRKVGGSDTGFPYIPLLDAKKAAYAAAGKVGLDSVRTGQDYASADTSDKTDMYYYLVDITKAGGTSGWEKLQKTAQSIPAEYKGLE